MATSIIINATTVSELRQILEEMCGTGQAQVIHVGDTKPDTSIADKAAADKAAADKAAADKAAADKAAKAKAEKLAKLKAEAAALEAGDEAPPAVVVEAKALHVDDQRAAVKARIAELKGSTRPNVVAEVKKWKEENNITAALTEMDLVTLTKLSVFLG